jgi:hypothetical protein
VCVDALSLGREASRHEGKVRDSLVTEPMPNYAWTPGVVKYKLDDRSTLSSLLRFS